MKTYPGTPAHQTLLRAITKFYDNDPRVLALGLFGSLSRGTWDAFSDLDLDVVLAEDVKLDVAGEVSRLVTALAAPDEPLALIIPDGKEAADVVLPSLMQFSIRYHPLVSTSPNIVDSYHLLAGSLDPASVQAAGRANTPTGEVPLHRLVDMMVRYALAVDVNLRRHRLWVVVELLHRIRGLWMEIFTRTRQGQRPLRYFEDGAAAELQAQLGQTLPQYDSASLREALNRLIHLLQHDLPHWSQDQLQLNRAQQEILRKVLKR